MKLAGLFALVVLLNISFSVSQLTPASPGFLLGDWVWNSDNCSSPVPFKITDNVNNTNGSNSSSALILEEYSWCTGSYYQYLTPFLLPFSADLSQEQLQQYEYQWNYNYNNNQEVYLNIVNETTIRLVLQDNNYYNSFYLDMYLTRNISNNTQTCNVTVNSVNFDLCALANSSKFQVADSLDGVLSFVLGHGQNDSSSVWGRYVDNIGQSHKVADHSPSYNFLNPFSVNQGIQIAFPIVSSGPSNSSNSSNSSNASSSSNSGRNFQLIINLACDPERINPNQIEFTSSLTANASANLETITVNGSSIYGCPTTLYNPSQLGSYIDVVDDDVCNTTVSVSGKLFNICPFDQGSVYDVNDILGGSLSFSVSTFPQTGCGYAQNVWGVYHDNANVCYEVATKNPTFSLYNQQNPSQGLQITYPIATAQTEGVRNFQLVVNVMCSYDEVNPKQIPFTMDVIVDSVDGIEILSVTGSSVYGCPLSSQW